MEVEEETTSNHLEESMAPETTIVINEIMIANTTSTDNESEKELNELISKSNIREEENSSVIVPKSEDTETSVMADLAPVSSGGIENSVVIESLNVVEDAKDVDDDVAAVECGGVEVSCTVSVDKERNEGDSEDFNGHDADSGGILAVQKDENEGDEKGSLKDCEGDEVADQFENEGDTNFQLEGDELENDGVVNDQLEDVENAKEMVGSDVQVDEAVNEEQVVAEVDKVEEMVSDKEEAVDIKGDVKKEVVLANEEIVDGVSGKDEKDTMVEDEEKSLDAEMETEKSLHTEMETEVSLDTEIENEKSLDKEMEAEKSLNIDIENEKSLDTEMETEKSLNIDIENEKSLDAEIENEKSLDTKVETEKSMDTEMVTEKSLDTEIIHEESLDTEIENEKSMNTDIEIEKSFDTEFDAEKSLDTEMENGEEANLADEERVQEGEIETGSSAKGSGGKRKRGRISKATPRKTIEEDVCFICFDGGDLVLCDRRNCPKAYHPSCVNRDESFFQSKGRWDCGWHFCTICEKKADYMCYTCTYSLCKACTKTSVLLCVREKEKKGLCEACMKIVMLIEKKGNVNLDDKNIMVPFFKDYWTETKAKHNLSLAELEHANNPWKGSGKQEPPSEKPDIRDDDDSDSDNPPVNLKTRKGKRNTKKHKSNKEDDTSIGAAAGSVGPGPESAEWASKDLLEFVTHMRNGDSSVISQFEVQDLLLEYIKRNKLRDPNRKSQIICDARLENLFGKPRVAHIEMLKLLESHFLVKEDSLIDDFQGTVVDTEISPVDDKGKKRKGRKKSDRRGPQSNREDYAAIDVHNISLIYLRRKLVEDLLDDMERFHGTIVGTFVRIRISGAHQKQDIYRLVQVTGTSEAARYTLSKRTTCTMLEILNLDKTETISIDSISNQDFMEDECKRLRQSIKCGLIRRLTVGDVLDKAMELQAVRVNDWFETEIVRLNHLRDRASDLGRKKELRECVEKLNVLKTPEEHAHRLEEFPLIHHDPTMDPEYESEDDTDSDDKRQELYKRSDSFRFNRRGRDQFSPRGDYTSKDSWSGTPRSSSRRSHEFTESWSGTPRSSSGKNIEFTESWSGTPRRSSAKNNEFTESWSGTPQSSSSKNYEFTKSLSNKNHSIKAEDSTTSFKAHKENARDPFVQQPIILEKPSTASPSIAADSAPKINESEKMWHYKDPSDKIQGPFSMIQLRKWSKNGYFPVGLKIWRKSDKEDDGILLTDALEGKFMVVNRRAVSQDVRSLNLDHTHGAQISSANLAPDSRHEAVSFTSPSPNKSTVGWTAGQAGPLTGPSSPSLNNTHMIACGNKDGNLAGSIGVSALQPPDSSTDTVSVASSVAPQNVGEGVQNPVQSSQLGQLVAPLDSNMQPQMVQSVSGQNPQVWSQNLQPNPSMNMTGLQPLVYSQWTGVPNMVQNPVGNFMPAPQEPWAQQFPFPVNQPNMQQLPQPLQPNVNWGTMAANPNMGWVGPNTGNPMNWGPMVQGPQVTGTVDPTWVMQAGNVPAGWVPQQAVQGVVPNQSWVATPVQGPVVAGNGNPGWVGPVPPGNNQVAPAAGWVAPNMNQVPTNMNSGWASGPGNQGAPVPNQGWVPPTGNQGTPPPPGNTNQNWGSRNRGGNWGGNDNRGNFPGERRNKRGFGFGGSRRSFNNRQESFHRDSRSTDKDDGSWRQESFHRDSRSADKDDGSWRQESFHRDGRLADKDDWSWRQESFHRNSRSTDKDDGLTHNDSGSFHGDGARSSNQ